MNTIAVIEDDLYIGSMLHELLQESGYRVLRAYSGKEALALLSKEEPDLVILDLMLPDMSGEEVLPAAAARCPVMIVSAKSDVGGKVKNLNAGAVDYITKPFDNGELLARIAVQLRRGDRAGMRIAAGDLVMDKKRHELTAAGKPVHLTKTEFAILRAFLENPTRVFSRSSLLEYIEAYVPDGEESSVGVHVSNIRKKLEEVAGRGYIETVWEIGFRLDPKIL